MVTTYKKGGETMKIQESAENYLEAILMLQQEKGFVRSIDIAGKLEFSKPSVSIAMKNLRENGYIEMDGDGLITLTAAGQAIAERVYERHVLLATWLEGRGSSRNLQRLFNLRRMRKES